MTDQWIADIMSDYRREFELCIQIGTVDNYWGRIERTDSGELVLTIGPLPETVQFPAKWLAEILLSADKDLPVKSAQPVHSTTLSDPREPTRLASLMNSSCKKT